MAVNIWGKIARSHWREHRPQSYAALKNPAEFFSRLGEEAANRYISLRDSQLEGKNPNSGTLTWTEYQEATAQADQAAREIVEREMIYLPPGEADQATSENDTN